MFSWKIARWICLITALVTAGLLLGILPSVLGVGLDYELMGFQLKTIVGIANVVVVYLLWKVL